MCAINAALVEVGHFTILAAMGSFVDVFIFEPFCMYIAYGLFCFLGLFRRKMIL